MAKIERPVHLVVRFSDTMFGVGDVVTLHNEIVNQHGSVWFGKMGQTISQSRIDKINQQIEKNITTYLFLVKGNRKTSTAYRAPLLKVTREIPKDQRCIPPYYIEKEILQFMKVFMNLLNITKINLEEMNCLRAINSIDPITNTLIYSSSGYFLVQEKLHKD